MQNRGHGTPLKIFPCKLCPKKFKWALSLKVHMATHTNKGDYKCMYCTREFVQMSHLKRHLFSHVRGTSGILYCKTCDRDFNFYKEMKHHLHHFIPSFSNQGQDEQDNDRLV
jgi:KRAB domain-containing zinc finger protein